MISVTLKVYNTRSKSTEIFEHDIDTPINMYTCGPTVYNRAHIGNLKTFLWSDFIVCYLNAIGYKTNHIMNITDIDDKIINSIEKQDMETLLSFTQKYTDLFLEDINAIGIRSYTKDNIHKVTDNIEPIVTMIKKLLESGHAYRVPDGSIYFDTSKVDKYPFPDFQKEAFSKNEDYVSERKIIRPPGVKSKSDFVLWKCKKEGEIFWKTDIGEGRMNWHLECSAITDVILNKLDIKIGALDLCFPHHNCEILQSEAYKPSQLYGKYWFHCGFLNFSGDKMSKSLGNILRLENVKHNYFLLRWYFLSKPYRHTFDYNEEELEKMKTDFVNFHMLYNKLILGFVKNNSKKNYPIENTYIYSELLDIISDDFNTKDALQSLFKYVDRLLKVYMDTETVENVLNELNKVNHLFNLLDKNILTIPDSTLEFINKREDLRKEKQFEASDAMRIELQEKYFFEDEQTGYLIINKI
jgi:cysteinyl-tRNA synthetase